MIYPDPSLFILVPAEQSGPHRVPQSIAITVDRSAHRVLLDLGFRSSGLAALNPTATRSLIDNLDLRHAGETRLPALGRGLVPRVLSLTIHPGLGVDLAVLGDGAPRSSWRIELDQLPTLVLALIDAIDLVDPYPLPKPVEPPPPHPTAATRIEFRRREPINRTRGLHIVRAGR
ncbi:hypothetical protein [Actinoalloteichus hymeniacidonis]|uniref:Uncharacterized protein n=1 Tax=Actinoalloteichus hymeniacidonis TaxID=340345 RepID=A0AAC9HUW3_9PSEU|nr:hypothetical protein [Actinoalloteichus hymeniacidonis]AOS64970.1 hypothetical protein TL08_20895 [Actinoalloteichus hymeniacidonis]MBB5906955.1 hypothetical protein [Actinoalloteichus hymeniacidonis]